MKILALESSQNLISYISRDLKIEWYNSAFAKAFGIVAEPEEQIEIEKLLEPRAYKRLRPLLEDGFNGNTTAFDFAMAQGMKRRNFHGTLTPENIPGQPARSLICQLNETTETDSIEQALIDRDLQLRLALKLSQTGICEVDLRRKNVFCDNFMKAITGFRKEAKPSLSDLRNLVHAEDRERVARCFQKAIQTKSDRYELEFRIVRQKDRAIRWVHATGQVLDGAWDSPERMFFIVKDISERKSAEILARESRMKIAHLLNHIPQLIWTTTATGELIYANERFIASTNIDPRLSSRKSGGSKNWIHSVHPQDAHSVVGKWNASMTSGEPFEAEYRLGDSSGNFTWVLGRAVPVRDESGQITEWFGTATDIRDKKEAEYKRTRTQRKVSQLQSIATSISVAHTPLEVAQIVIDQGLDATDAVAGAVFLFEPGTGRLPLLYSRGVARTTLDKVAELSIHVKLPVTDAVVSREPIFIGDESALADYPDIEKYNVLRRKSVAALPLMVQGEALGALVMSFETAAPFSSERVGCLTILAEQCAQSIERARLFEAERHARRAAELAMRAKSQFLANMSHEIRTPMNAILGFADLLADRTLAEEEREEYRRRIRMNGDQLMHLIDDVLDLTKMENGRIALQKVPFSVGDLASEVFKSLLPIAKKKGIDARLVIENSVPRMIESDPTRLRQILMSLLGNSIKFTDHGRIETRIGFVNSQLTVEVEDTGIGISHELHERLFQPFSQGDSSVTRRFGGSGLGLVVSRGIAEAMGGSLDHIRSEESQGSIFRLTIPIAQELENPQIDMFDALSAESKKSSHELEGVNVLLVEDSFDNEMLIRAYLKGTGVQLEVAHNGAEAVKRATLRDFDVVFMDIQMPVMDGLEATRRLREQNYDGPIVALSAHALPEEIERSIAAGCRSHLTKPIMRDVLIDQIRSFAFGSAKV